MDKNRLKFRVWDAVAERFVTRSSGGFGWPDSSEIKFNLNGELFIEEEYGEKTLSSSRYIIQQYTGLQDSEGKYIYEGDILEIPRNYYINGKQQFIYGEVYFYDYKFAVRSKKEKDYYPIGSLAETSIVVGNIFENKDLLK